MPIPCIAIIPRVAPRLAPFKRLFNQPDGLKLDGLKLDGIKLEGLILGSLGKRNPSAILQSEIIKKCNFILFNLQKTFEIMIEMIYKCSFYSTELMISAVLEQEQGFSHLELPGLL